MDKEKKEELWAELETQGEDSTREKFGLGDYDGRRKRAVTEWLRQKDQDSLKPPWYETWWGMAAITVLIIVVAAALISYFDLG